MFLMVGLFGAVFVSSLLAEKDEVEVEYIDWSDPVDHDQDDDDKISLDDILPSDKPAVGSDAQPDNTLARTTAWNTSSGTAKDDIIEGTAGHDKIRGLGGDDQLIGGLGDDSLLGNAGKDILVGGAGADLLYGGAGNDTLQAGEGNDTAYGGTGNDSIIGDLGDDLLYGGAGHDTLAGGLGNDVLHGAKGDDWLGGGGGNDLLYGGAGSDTLDGNNGNDTLYGGNGAKDDREVDYLNGGNGDDVLWLMPKDIGHGGEGADVFNLSQWLDSTEVIEISDYNAIEDKLVVLYDPKVHADPKITVEPLSPGSGVHILVDGAVVAKVNTWVDPEDIKLLAS